ncbi:MAG: type II secretory pathway pseudopilin PulG [Burkholderiaceae bacterium]|jgi:type II secretory pathway pseudopilin PulG
MQKKSSIRQRGMTLISLVVILMLVGVVVVLGLKVVPTAIEFMSIKKAIAVAKATGTSPMEIRAAFDRQANVGYIESISSKDLDIVKDGDQIDINVAYQKKIPLIGPTWLLIDYSATTVKAAARKPAA